MNCPKCGENINLNKNKIDNAIIRDNSIKDNLNEIKLKLENIINNSSNNSLNIKLNDINKLLGTINQDVKLNIKNFLNLLDNNEIKDKEDINNENNMTSKNSNPNNIKFMKNKKSKLIIKKIFDYMDEKIKLKTIKYNKNLKDELNIKLANYKFFSGKYFSFE